MPLTSHYFYPFRAPPTVKSRRSCCKSLNTTQHDDIIMQLGHARPSESPRPTLPLNAIFVSFFLQLAQLQRQMFLSKSELRQFPTGRSVARVQVLKLLCFIFFSQSC